MPTQETPAVSPMLMPGESAEYRRRRDELLAAEIALKDQRERVAALRRSLPHGGPVPQDYRFREGSADLEDDSPSGCRETRLSELFAPGKDELILIHYMFAADQALPCPMCTMWADSYNAVAPHLRDKVSFALVAKADLAKLRAWARGRGWTNLRLLSSHDNEFNRDYHVEEASGGQRPGVSVFVRRPGGEIRHFYSTEASLGPGHHRGIDLYTPVWNLLDLLPSGRGSWMPRLSYDPAAAR
ncbi:MAG TPA: DUF899 family protein [Thermoanaerobaculia bacterium]|nr:DUF899 family protein [Thermoanaerobaculia bacterium]